MRADRNHRPTKTKMNTLTTVKDGSGRYFDLNTATQYNEGTEFDGNNMISIATGSQWEHEKLYHSASGTWILNHWSQWQGSTERDTVIDDTAAAIWLANNGHLNKASKLAPQLAV